MIQISLGLLLRIMILMLHDTDITGFITMILMLYDTDIWMAFLLMILVHLIQKSLGL